MDNATLIQLLRNRGQQEPLASYPDVAQGGTPLSPAPPAGQSPTMTDAFSRLQALSGKAVDYAPIGRIAAGNIENADRDRQYGMILQGLGGKHLAPVGKQILEHALEQGKPFRPNAADTAYMDPETGQMIENPAAPLAREIKVTENEVAQRRAEEVARLKREEDAALKRENQAMLERIAGAKNTTNITIGAGHDEAAKERAKLAAAAHSQGVPAAIASKIGAVQAEKQTMQEALALARAHPNAFGWSQGLPTMAGGEIGQKLAFDRLTPEEKVARSAVYERVSGLMKERAGTAVSASEKKTILGFVPGVNADLPEIESKYNQYLSHLDKVEAGHWSAAKLARPGSGDPATNITGQVADRRVNSPAAGAAAELARRRAAQGGQ